MEKLNQLYKRIISEKTLSSITNSVSQKNDYLIVNHKLIHYGEDERGNDVYYICSDSIQSDKRTIKNGNTTFKIVPRTYIFKSNEETNYSDVFEDIDIKNKSKIKSETEKVINVKVCCSDDNITLNKILDKFNVKKDEEEVNWKYKNEISIYLLNGLEVRLIASQNGYSNIKCSDSVLTDMYETAISKSVTNDEMVETKDIFIDQMNEDFNHLQNKDLYIDTCWSSYGYTIKTVPTAIKTEIIKDDNIDNYECVRYDMSAVRDFSAVNPTDIWLINKNIATTDVLSEYDINSFTDSNISTVITTLNQKDKNIRPKLYNILFDNNLLIGISLKKIEDKGGNKPQVEENGFEIEVKTEHGKIKAPNYTLNKKGNCSIQIGDFFLDIRIKQGSAGVEARSSISNAARAGKGNVIVSQYFKNNGFNYKDTGSLKNSINEILNTQSNKDKFMQIMFTNPKFTFLNDSLDEDEIEFLINEKSDDPINKKLKLLLLLTYLIQSQPEPNKFAYQILAQITKSNCSFGNEVIYEQPYKYYLIH